MDTARLARQTKYSGPGSSEDFSIQSRLGRRLRELRYQRNWTQLRMAEDFGIDRAFLSDVERGRKAVSLRTLEVLALGMRMTISDLLDGI